MTTVIDQYKASGHVVLDIDLRLGHTLDQSGYGNDVASVTSDCWWGCGRLGQGIFIPLDGYMTVADSAELRVTSWTALVLADFNEDYGTNRYCQMMAKEPLVAGANGVWFYMRPLAGGGIATWDGALVSQFNCASQQGVSLLGCRAPGAATPSHFYSNGAYLGVGGLNQTFPSSALPWYLGGGNTGRGMRGMAHRFVLFDVATVTDAEMAQIYIEMMDEPVITRLPRHSPRSSYRTPGDIAACCAYDGRTDAGDLVDVSGAGNNLVRNSGDPAIALAKPSHQHEGLIVPSTTRYYGAAVAGLFGPTDGYLIEMWAELLAAPAADHHYVSVYDNGGTLRWSIYGGSGTGNVDVACYQDGGDRSFAGSQPIANRGLRHFVLRWVPGDFVRLYVDTLAGGASAAAYASCTLTPADVSIGHTNASNTSFVCHGMRVIPEGRTYGDVVRMYLEGAKRLQWAHLGIDTVETLAAIATPGQELPLTNVSVTRSGDSWTTAWDGTRKYAVAGSANATMHWHNPSAWGTWYAQVYKSAAASTIEFLFVASVADWRSAGGQNGYMVSLSSTVGATRLYRVTAGATNLLASFAIGAISNGTWYELVVARHPSTALITVWIKGGIFTVWYPILSATDANHTTSEWSVVTSATVSGVRVSDVRKYQGYLDPTQGQLPEDV